MFKKQKSKIISIIIFIILFVVFLGIGYGLIIIRSQQEMSQVIQARSHHISTRNMNTSVLHKYGSVKFIKNKNQLVFTARPYIAKQIKHTKIGDKLPGKFSHLADKDTQSTRIHQHDAQLHEKIIPDN